MATAELAVGLPLLMLFVLLGAGVIDGVRDGLRCGAAARAAARAAAGGESSAVVQAAAQAIAPDGARVTTSESNGVVTVSVSTHVGIPGPWNDHGPHVALTARAVAQSESGWAP